MRSFAPSWPSTRRRVPGLAACCVLLLAALGCTEQSPTFPPDDVLAVDDAVDAQVGIDTGCAKGCDDNNPCTVDTCSGAVCTHAAKLDGACDDGNPCTTLDSCGPTGCVGLKQLDCDDKNPCTVDTCDPAKGCAYSVTGAIACDDGDGCTENDVCKGGKCGTGGALTCDDGNLCTTDTCDIKSGCQFTNNTAPCTDGNACTLGDMCSGGKCAAGVEKACADDNACTDDKCDSKSGDCVFLPSAVTCDDGNVLTSGDTCYGGQCIGAPGCGCTADAQCDDKNPCTKDVCAGGCCVAAALAGSVTCSDGNVCTQNDSCDGGSCISGAKLACDDGNLCTDDACLPELGCTHTPNTAKCEDGIACSTDHVCKAGGCTGTITTCACQSDTDCSDNNACTDDACVGGKCVTKPSGAGKACEDGNGCTLSDTCQAGTCLPGALTTCADDNPCTNDACNPNSGACVHSANFSGCTDGNACTTGETCAGGACNVGVPVDCDDHNVCTTDSCDPSAPTGQSACSHSAVAGVCDDSSACTTADTCVAGVCVGTPTNVCDDGNACTQDACGPGVGGGKMCTHSVASGSCDDGDPCTTSDACVGVQCVGLATVCDDQNPCTADSCAPDGVCQHAPTSAPCSDGNACTAGDTCIDGLCTAGTLAPCDDNDACTTDLCDATAGCSHVAKADGATCGEATCVGLVHSAESVCASGVCVPGASKSCKDSSACTDDACDAAVGCSHTDNSGPCSDGNLCTVGDICSSGVCLPGAATTCDDGNLCSVDACDPSSGCQHVAATDGTTCAVAGCVGAVLGAGGVCQSGACALNAPPINCSDANPCTDDFCAPGSGCLHQTNSAPCDDGNACTTNDSCSLGACVGNGAANCNDNNACTDDACLPGSGCAHSAAADGQACDDGSMCTIGDACAGGSCKPGSALVCDDKNPCTDDACNAKTGCAFTNNSAPCNDGSQCSGNDVCAGGKCGVSANPCDDGNPCTTDGCDGVGGCTHTAMADGASCSSQGCTGGLFQGAAKCLAGSCGIPPAQVSCDDANTCTDDVCNGLSGCLHALNALACDDGNACTKADACNAGTCAGSATACADGGPCAQSLGCNPASGCQYQPLTGQPCSDGNACTVNDTCSAGTCSPGTAAGCDDKNSCTTDSCDPVKGCVWTPILTGTCSDGTVCTGTAANPDVCVSGTCVAGASLHCDDDNACTNDSCDPIAGCQHTNNTASCKDGDKCTTNDFCAGGSCHAGTPVVCNDGNPCTVDSCDPAQGCTTAKMANGTTCGGGACAGLKYTAAGMCTSGQCVLPAAKNCDDGVSCTTDVCDPTLGCSNAVKAWGTSCVPANAALLAPFCAGTTCTGFEVKVGEPGSATQGALTSIDRNVSGVFASGWDNAMANAAQQGDVRSINQTTLAVSNAGAYGVAKSHMNDLRDTIAVGGIGDNVPAIMLPVANVYVPTTVTAAPSFSRAFNAIDAFTTGAGETFVFGGAGNSNAEFSSNVGVMTLAGGTLSGISRLMITTSPTQCAKQVAMSVNDIYAASNAAVYFAGYIGSNGQAPTQSAVAVWDGSASNTCDGVDFSYGGEVYTNTPTSTVDRVVAIGTGIGQGAYRTIHGTSAAHLLVGGTLGTLWSYDNGTWTQQTPAVGGPVAWSTQFDVKSVFLADNNGWVTGEFYGPSGASSNCRQVFVLHGVFDPATSLWTWNQLAFPGLVDCGATIANTQANKIWQDPASKAIFVVGSYGGQELVSRIQLP